MHDVKFALPWRSVKGNLRDGEIYRVVCLWVGMSPEMVAYYSRNPSQIDRPMWHRPELSLGHTFVSPSRELSDKVFQYIRERLLSKERPFLILLEYCQPWECRLKSGFLDLEQVPLDNRPRFKRRITRVRFPKKMSGQKTEAKIKPTSNYPPLISSRSIITKKKRPMSWWQRLTA